MKTTTTTLILGALALANAAPQSVPLVRRPDIFLTDAEVKGIPALHSKISANPASRYHQLARGTSTVRMSGGWLFPGAYYVNVTTYGQSFGVLVDTGSSNLLLPGIECSSCGTQVLPSSVAKIPFSGATCNKCTLVDGGTRCPFMDPFPYGNANVCGMGVTYGGGSSSVSGYLATGDVSLSGSLLAKDLPINVVTRESPSLSFFQAGYGTGLLGLAYPYNACNPTCVDTFMDKLVATTGMSNEFAMCLNSAGGGIVDFGGVVSERARGPFTYTPILREHWFNFGVQGIIIGGQHKVDVDPVLFQVTNDVIGTFTDSGTSIVLMGPEIFASLTATFQQFYGYLGPAISGSSNLFTGACFVGMDPVAYPTISFVLGNSTSTVDLPPSSYLIPGPNSTSCLGISAVASLGVILGDIFMQNYYIHHDIKNRRIGFAPLASTCN